MELEKFKAVRADRAKARNDPGATPDDKASFDKEQKEDDKKMKEIDEKMALGEKEIQEDKKLAFVRE